MSLFHFCIGRNFGNCFFYRKTLSEIYVLIWFSIHSRDDRTVIFYDPDPVLNS